MDGVAHVAAAGVDEERTVQRVAMAHVGGRRRRGWLAIAVGVLVFGGGGAGFAVYGSRSDALAKDGIHTTAVVTGIHVGVPFDNYVLVGYPSAEAYEQSVHVRTADRPRRRYRVGQPLRIVYDRANPRRAQLEQDPDIGPVGAPFALALLAGGGLVFVGARTLALCRAARRALRTRPRTMGAASSVNRRWGRLIHLFTGDDAIGVTSLRRRDWWGPELRLDDPASLDLLPVAVFRDPKRARVVVVADAEGRGVAVGREVRMPRLLRLLLPRALRAERPRDAFGASAHRRMTRS
jgi:hypothetical protein